LETTAGTDRAALPAYTSPRPSTVYAGSHAAHPFLQQWYALSDSSIEEAPYDTAMMRGFAGISSLYSIPMRP